MGTTVKDILKAKPYPKWLLKHPIFKEVETLRKVFPGIGLCNFEDVVEVDNAEKANKYAKALASTITTNLASKVESIAQSKKVKPNDKEVIEVIKSTHKGVNKKKDVVSANNGKLSLKMPIDIVVKGTDKPVFRQNESLFRVYNKLNALLAENKIAPMRKLEDMSAFKKFSTENVPKREYKVVFSSTGIEGAWDIATMSMRGISSCQSWNGEYKQCVIGSMLDPFVGIIYLTSGEKHNEYGSKMMRRCMVRFAVSAKKQKPCICLDNMYPSFDAKVLAQFTDAIRARVGDKFDVKYLGKISDGSFNDLYSPETDLHIRLKGMDANGGKLNGYYRRESIASYQDNAITDKKPAGALKDSKAALYEHNRAKKERKFNNTLRDAIYRAIGERHNRFLNNAKVGHTKVAIAKIGAYILDEVISTIADGVLDTLNEDDFTNSDTYIRRAYYNYFNRALGIVRENKSKLAKNLNGRLHLDKKMALRGDDVVALMSEILPHANDVMRKELHAIVERRKFSGALPLP